MFTDAVIILKISQNMAMALVVTPSKKVSINILVGVICGNDNFSYF